MTKLYCTKLLTLFTIHTVSSFNKLGIVFIAHKL